MGFERQEPEERHGVGTCSNESQACRRRQKELISNKQKARQ